MAHCSNWLESGLRSYLFRTNDFVKPTVLAIALSSGTPNDSFVGSQMLEWANAGGYVRQTLNPSNANWSADDNTNGYTYNNQAITFPVCTTDCGWVSGICLVDSATYGVGNIIIWGSATVPKYFALNDQVVIPVSGLSFQIL